MKSTNVTPFLSTVSILLFATQALATTQECVLTIPGVPGESTIVANGIDLLSFSFGVRNAPRATSASGGGRAGRPEFSEFIITKKLDKSSPSLMLSCAAGTHYHEATISCRKAGGESSRQVYLMYTLSDVLVSSYQGVGSSGSDVPTDQVSFNFDRIDFNYHPQHPDGSLGPPVNACWDLRAERVCR
jgi:type VI secretion system secreted protein Hcp